MIRLRSQASALPFNLTHWNGEVFTEDSYNTAVDFKVIDGLPMTVRVAMVDLKAGTEHVPGCRFFLGKRTGEEF
jgi:hypothetical protein